MEPGSQDNPTLGDAFETRVSIWKSFSSARYGEEKPSENLDDSLLEHPVVDSTKHSLFRDGEKSPLEERLAVSPFWAPDEAEIQNQESEEAVCPISEPSLKKFKDSMEPREICDDGILSPAICEEQESSSEKPRICNGVVECIGRMAERDDGEAEQASESILRLENKVRTLSTQLDTCRQALSCRERTIRELERSIEMLRSEQGGRADYELVGECARRGLEIVGELRSIDSPRDFTEENYSLRIENMSLKNIVEELAGRVKALREVQRD